MIDNIAKSGIKHTSSKLLTSGGGDKPTPPVKEITDSTVVKISEEAIQASTRTSGGGDKPTPPEKK